jgi:hypothetical protein
MGELGNTTRNTYAVSRSQAATATQTIRPRAQPPPIAAIITKKPTITKHQPPTAFTIREFR